MIRVRTYAERVAYLQGYVAGMKYAKETDTPLLMLGFMQNQLEEAQRDLDDHAQEL